MFSTDPASQPAQQPTGSDLCSAVSEQWPVEQVCAALELLPHPEGGWYRETHRSAVMVQRADGHQRSAFTRILYLLPAGGLSRWHRVRGSEEVWRLLKGAPLNLWQLPPDGGEPALTQLANSPGGTELCVVPADWWQAARATNGWSLVSCWVAPGFTFDDFELLAPRPAAAQPPGAHADLL